MKYGADLGFITASSCVLAVVVLCAQHLGTHLCGCPTGKTLLAYHKKRSYTRYLIQFICFAVAVLVGVLMK